MPLTDERLPFMVFCLGISMHMYILFYWGQRITDESLNVAIACSDPNFMDADVSLQKGLILMMQMAQSSRYLTAGKFLRLSLETLVTVSHTCV